MGTAEFEAFVTRATFLDRPDPIAAWRELSARQAALVERLGAARGAAHRGRGHRPHAARRRPHLGQLRRAAQHALAARSSPARSRTRRTAASASRSPRARAASRSPGSSSSSATASSSTRAPSTATTTCWRRSTPTRAPGGWARSASARTSGIDRPVGAILFDEKIGGTVHLAVGRSYPETGGTNESAVHWDMICDLRAGGRLLADGEVRRSEDGVFALQRYGLRRSCAVRRSSPPSVRPPATPRSSSGWSRPGWTSRA